MKYYIVDAFAEELFSGNPAGVCVLDTQTRDSEGASHSKNSGSEPINSMGSMGSADEIMQKIAFENNLSETAFLIREEDHYHIRWFSPKKEIDLCGHATLASAFIIKNFIEKDIEEIPFKSMSGSLRVFCGKELYTLDFPALMPKKIESVSGLGEILGADIKETYLARDLMAVVEDEKTVQALEPDYEKMTQMEICGGLIVTAPGDHCDFVSRCFFPKYGIKEDPVTGSAHCNLIPYWAKQLHKNEMEAKQLSQRGGRLWCRLEGERVKISGKAKLYLEGRLYL